MCFRKRIKTADLVKEDREKIYSNSKFIQTIIARCNDAPNLVEKLKDLQEKLKYLIPSQKSEVFDYEKAIEKKIIELNRAMMSCAVDTEKADEDFYKKINNFIIDIYVLMADRNTIL